MGDGKHDLSKHILGRMKWSTSALDFVGMNMAEFGLVESFLGNQQWH